MGRMKFTGVSAPNTPASVVINADNGLSVSANVAVLGQDFGDVTNPAVLLSNREIPTPVNKSILLTDVPTSGSLIALLRAGHIGLQGDVTAPGNPAASIGLSDISVAWLWNILRSSLNNAYQTTWGGAGGSAASRQFFFDNGNMQISENPDSSSDNGSLLQLMGATTYAHLSCGSNDPKDNMSVATTVTLGAAAGAGASVVFSGNDACGSIAVTTGAVPGAAGDLITINCGRPYKTAAGYGSLIPMIGINGPTVPNFEFLTKCAAQIVDTQHAKVSVGAVALTALTTYSFFYHLMQ